MKKRIAKFYLQPLRTQNSDNNAPKFDAPEFHPKGCLCAHCNVEAEAETAIRSYIARVNADQKPEKWLFQKQFAKLKKRSMGRCHLARKQRQATVDGKEQKIGQTTESNGLNFKV